MNKKSIFYTIAAIALTAVIFVTYSAYTSYRLAERMDTIGTRIETVNFFIKDVEKDLSKGIYISAFRKMMRLKKFITTNGSFIADVDGKFKESFLNGTINNQPMSLMAGSTFNDWANKISAEADKIDIKSNFTVNEVRLNQSDPWEIEVMVGITFDIRDERNTSYWIRDRNLTTKISVIGFEDPLYVINSNGRVTNAISKSNITAFVVNGNVENLLLHMNDSLYIAHDDAPSFLMRLEGDLGNSTYGIESLVDLEEFQQQGLAIKDRSIVDYIYFGTKSTTNYRINNTPEWFKIDHDHLPIYEVTNLTI